MLLLGEQIPSVVLRGGDAGTADTLRFMAALARRSSRTPVVRAAAVDIVRHVGQNTRTQRAAILEWLSTRVSFLRDIDRVELTHTPEFCLQQIAVHGSCNVDCDDAAILAAALGLAIGLPARMVAYAFVVPNRPPVRAPFSHVVAELRSPASSPPDWVPMDATRRSQNFDGVRVARQMVQAV